jgi:ArsR family transcriptional regulator, arsenate/arsenite/antimonite-responsive transcriptional repressor
MPEDMTTMARKKKQDIDRELLVDAFKALSNENRLTIFEHIRKGCGRGRIGDDKRPAVCEVASNVNAAPSTISHHIKELRRARLIQCERRGQTIL